MPDAQLFLLCMSRQPFELKSSTIVSDPAPTSSDTERWHFVRSDPLPCFLPSEQLHTLSSLDSEPPLGKVRESLLRALSHNLGVLGAEASADGTSLLGSEVEGSVLLVFVEEAELLALGCVDDGEGAGDGLADVVAVVGDVLVSCSIWLFCLHISSGQ